MTVEHYLHGGHDLASCLSWDSGNNLPPCHLLNSGHAYTLHCSLADTHHCASPCSFFHMCSWAEHMSVVNDSHDIMPLAAPIPLSLYEECSSLICQDAPPFTHTHLGRWLPCCSVSSPFRLPGHTADSDSTCHESELQGPFLWDCSPAFWPPASTYIQGYLAPGAESSLSIPKGVIISSQFRVVYKLI